MAYDFSGKTALVTGAGKGIGRAIAKELALCGAEVIALSRTQEDLDSLKKEIISVKTICVDISDMTAVQKQLESLGPIHLLVNNAAVADLQPFLEVTPDSYDRVMNINVKAVLFVSQLIAKKMIEQSSGGAIVNVSSQASQVALKDHTAYCVSKGALDMLTKMMGLELGPHKIRVNSINPTVVMTDMGKLAWSDPAKANPMLARIPLGRFADVGDVVNAVLFLLSDRSAMINAAMLPVDGGFLSC
ncbi:hypothetical protein EMCRGX_G027990 [Ephydatia muelleri]|eukprot:Em0020g657a